jgi:hypothetical protein
MNSKKTRFDKRRQEFQQVAVDVPSACSLASIEQNVCATGSASASAGRVRRRDVPLAFFPCPSPAVSEQSHDSQRRTIPAFVNKGNRK